MNNPAQHPLPEGVHDSFTYTCLFCSGTVKVVASIRLPHECEVVYDLARIIKSPESFDGGPVSCGPNDVYAARTAAAILAAGWRPPTPPAHAIKSACQGHDYINVGSGALYCKPCEVLVTERDGAAAVLDMKEHETNVIPDEAVDEQVGYVISTLREHLELTTAEAETIAKSLLASIATRLRELPFEELQSEVAPKDWTECLNVHNVINDVADWIAK